MELTGKKINFLGDSITEGVGVQNPENRFVDRITRMAGLAAGRNYGISGTRIARQFHPTLDNPRFDLDFCSRVDSMDPDADVVIVFGGTNDFGHGDAPIGTFADRTPDTFYGACHTLMRSLTMRYPGKPIVIMTPLHRVGEDNPDRKGMVLSDYVDMIRETARYYSLPVLDLFAMSGIQPCVDLIRERFCPDGLHPNDDGHAIMAERIVHFLRAL